MDPITDQDLPQEGIVENIDGSVDIHDLEPAVKEQSGDFQENLAELFDKTTLDNLGRDFCESVARDRESRKKRDKQYEDGLRRTGMGDDAPGGADFEGASDVVHPVLAEACVDFAARAIKELFPPQGPVKTATIGPTDEAQLDRAERKRTFLNWQLTTQMQEYRSELEQLLTQLPLGGSQFQKFWHDDRFKRPVSEFVPIDDILLPYSAKSFYTAQRVTHVQHLTRLEFEQRINSELYRDIEGLSDVTGLSPDQTDSAVANDKIEGKEEDAYNEDGLRDVYEIYAWEQLDDDMVSDEPAPYIITIDAYSEKVLAIYRNWKEDDVALEKLDWLVEWKFIPWRGAYAIGFPQLIGSLSAAATGALRALLDSAHINNLPGLVKLKGSGVSGQNIDIQATGVTEITGPVGIDDIRKLLMAMPFNPPSSILFQLLGWLTEAAKGVVRTAESAIANAGDRTPVGTTQAMIEQGSTIYSAIHARLHESQKRALQILCRINGTWLDEETEIADLGKLIIRRDDFIGSLDVIPVSDPAIFSEAQRYAQNQSLMQMQGMDAQDPSVPWNKVAIRRRALKQMRIDNIDEILPLPVKPLTSDPMSEMVAVLSGKPIIAQQTQDHLSHIKGHLLYLSSPTVLNNPLVQPQPLSMILSHVQQHVMFYEQAAVTQAIQALSMQAFSNGAQPSQDLLVAAAIQQTAKPINDTLSPLLQRVAEIQQVIQSKIPPPQLPPEVQASIQIAKMDIDRKTAYDKASLDAKAAEQQTKQQTEQAQFSMDAQQQQFEQALEQQRLQLEDRNNQLAKQIELMNNRADNQQKQMTELLKNRDDNETNMQIAMAKLQEVSSQVALPQQTQDLSPMVQQMQEMLSQIEKAKTGDALTATMDGLRAVLTGIHAPTELIRDANGRAVGARKVI